MSDSDTDYPPLHQNLFDVHSVSFEYAEVIEPSTTLLPSLPPSPLRMTPLKMVDGGSSRKQPMLSFSARIDKKTPLNVELNNIRKHTTQDNYQIRSPSMKTVLRGIKAYEIVLDGVYPAEDADQTGMDGFEHRIHRASTIISKRQFCLGGMAPSVWTRPVQGVRDSPLADVSTPGINSTRRVAYCPMIAVSQFLFALSISDFEQTLWRCGQLWPYIGMGWLGTCLHRDCNAMGDAAKISSRVPTSLCSRNVGRMWEGMILPGHED